MATSSTGIHKLYVAVLVQSELQTLRGVVYFGRDYGIREMDVIGKLLIDVEQRSPLGEALRHVVVLTADLKHERSVFVIWAQRYEFISTFVPLADRKCVPLWR